MVLNLGKPISLQSTGVGRCEKKPEFFFHGNPDIRKSVESKSAQIQKVQENCLKGPDWKSFNFLNREYGEFTLFGLRVLG